MGSALHTGAGFAGLADEANALVGQWIESVAEARAAGVGAASPT